jgi:hypothetical protein
MSQSTHATSAGQMAPEPRPPGRTRRVLRWVGWGVFFTIEGTAVGALLGAVTFPLVAWMIEAERSTAEFVLLGARNLGFWFFIWSPGVALVRCVMRWQAEREQAAASKDPAPC